MNGMRLDRRGLMLGGGALALGGLLPHVAFADIETNDLKNMTGNALVISQAERLARIEQARRLMHAARIDAVLIEPGASMIYFTGVEWHRSERLTAALLFAEGDPIIVTPFFEEPSVRETLAVPAQVRVWQEDEDPIALLAQALRERGLASATVGVEETVRFFASDGLAHHLPHVRLTSANPIVRGCRMIKSATEIALMRLASDITIAAYRWTWPRVREGMNPHEIGAMLDAATLKLGGSPEFSLVLLGEAAAYPHGSHKPQRVREGEVVLMDCGCTVQGYQSDVSRTFVPGRAPDAVRAVWDIVHEGQQIAFRTARIETPTGAIGTMQSVAFTKARAMGHATGSPACRTAPGMASGWTGMSRSISCMARRRRFGPACAFRTSPGCTCPASSVFASRIAST